MHSAVEATDNKVDEQYNENIENNNGSQAKRYSRNQ